MHALNRSKVQCSVSVGGQIVGRVASAAATPPVALRRAGVWPNRERSICALDTLTASELTSPTAGSVDAGRFADAGGGGTASAGVPGPSTRIIAAAAAVSRNVR